MSCTTSGGLIKNSSDIPPSSQELFDKVTLFDRIISIENPIVGPMMCLVNSAHPAIRSCDVWGEAGFEIWNESLHGQIFMEVSLVSLIV
jgi:hypothetical protein